MIAVYPTPEQIQGLLKGPADQPVVMLNLLRFKERATEPDQITRPPFDSTKRTISSA